MKPSIRHNPVQAALPDFRNLGVWLRIILGANVLALLWVFARNNDFRLFADEFMAVTLWVDPPLFVLLPMLHACSPSLANLPLVWGRAAVLAMVVAVSTLEHLALAPVLPSQTPAVILHAAACALLTG